MGNEKRIRKAITSLFELPAEITLNIPVVNLLGKEELSIENFKSIAEYGDTRVRVTTSCGQLKVEGESLTLKQLTSEHIVVAGQIKSVEYI